VKGGANIQVTTALSILHGYGYDFAPFGTTVEVTAFLALFDDLRKLYTAVGEPLDDPLAGYLDAMP